MRLTNFELCLKIGELGLNEALIAIKPRYIKDPETSSYWEKQRKGIRKKNIFKESTYSNEEVIELLKKYEDEGIYEDKNLQVDRKINNDK